MISKLTRFPEDRSDHAFSEESVRTCPSAFGIVPIAATTSAQLAESHACSVLLGPLNPGFHPGLPSFVPLGLSETNNSDLVRSYHLSSARPHRNQNTRFHSGTTTHRPSQASQKTTSPATTHPPYSLPAARPVPDSAPLCLTLYTETTANPSRARLSKSAKIPGASFSNSCSTSTRDRASLEDFFFCLISFHNRLVPSLAKR